MSSVKQMIKLAGAAAVLVANPAASLRLARQMESTADVPAAQSAFMESNTTSNNQATVYHCTKNDCAYGRGDWAFGHTPCDECNARGIKATQQDVSDKVCDRPGCQNKTPDECNNTDCYQPQSHCDDCQDENRRQYPFCKKCGY